jgi:hypothetical protein
MIHALLLVLVPRQPKYQTYSFNLIGGPVGIWIKIHLNPNLQGRLFMIESVR